MRKLMVLATVLAMMLVAAAPAFAHDGEFSVANNAASFDVSQASVGDQNAASVEGDAFNAANGLGISSFQANSAFNVLY